MHRAVVCAGIFCATVVPAARAQIVYEVSFPNVVHHEAEISISFTDLPAVPLELRMSRSSPGRYALHDFAKNVYSVRAEDGNGFPLQITRPNPYQWDVPVHDGTVRVTYTLFADRADGTYSQVDETHAHLNVPATFMWARGLGDRQIRVTFQLPDGAEWSVATQLFPTDDPMTFTAPDLYYFMDSPIEVSDFALRQWEVSANGGTSTIRLAVHHDGTEQEVDDYTEMVKKVVEQAIAVFGEAPDFDGGAYTFIADYLPWVSGDGMEHRNSTILSSTASLRRAAGRLIGTVAHEFFHAWNVERIRPRTLEPFDFERANMSGELWFAEGFTSYY
ncbi:MAG: M61 family metallopeptidase, partial [Gemmatimonadetes bacterium]|nr:M61 family metallopeptidase [Gemmatimonadota bacterium]